MSELLSFTLLGLAVGALYALTAHGLVLIHRGSGVVNFAQGAVGMVGAYVYYDAAHSWPTPARWAAGLLCAAALGVVVQVGIMRRLRKASPLVRLVSTLGVLFVLIAVGEELWGDHYEIVKSPLPTTPRRLFGDGAAISEDRLWLIGIAILITAALALLFRRTRFGNQVEAVAQHPVAAASLGINPDHIAAINWALGSALAALAGILLAPVLALSVAVLAFTVLRALAAALVGRFQSFWVTLAAAMGIGVVESLVGRWGADPDVLGPLVSDGLFLGQFTAQSLSRSVAFLVVVGLLIARGTALPGRGELLDRLPALGSGSVHRPALIGFVVLAGTLLLTVPDGWASAAVMSMAIAIVCLSLVVVTGYAGQLSLAQMGLAGLAAWIAGRLVDAAGWPALPAAIMGVAGTVLLGVIVAIPALRTRGTTLAILTFGMAVVFSELVFQNPALTGGLTGTELSRLELLGYRFDALDHPGRYGVVVLVCLVGSGLFVARLRRGAVGRRLIAVRSNERAAAALGIDVDGVKIFAFAVAAALAGVGGILLAFRQTFLDYGAFEPFASISVVVYSVIGGIGFVIGGLLAGPFIVGGLGGEFVQAIGFEPHDIEWLTGLVLVAMLLSQPDGIAGEHIAAARVVRDRVRRRSAAGIASDLPAGPDADAGAAEAGEPRRPLQAAQRTTPEVVVAAVTSRTHGAPDRHALLVEHATVRFGGVLALDDVTLRVAPGEVVGLIGPNGAGKTTLIDAISGFVRTSQGAEITLGPVDLSGLDPAARARAGVGRSFQSLELFNDMTVRENLLVACEPWKRAFYVTDLFRTRGAELTPNALAAVDEFELSGVLDTPVDQLPHATQRLVGIARAVAATPAVLLLDEPAAGLSEAGSSELGHLIRALAHRQNIGVLLVEHDVPLVMRTCDRVSVLNFGQIIASGSPDEISTNPDVVAAYLGGEAATVAGQQ